MDDVGAGVGLAEAVDASAVVAFRDGEDWQVGPLPESVADDLDDLVAAVRQQPADGAFALVDVAGDFFVVVRVQHGQVLLLLSDVTAAAEWDLADQVLERLGMPAPDDDDLDDVAPAGDLDVFADLGLAAWELGAVVADDDAYADELLVALARRLGFGDRYERVVAALGGR